MIGSCNKIGFQCRDKYMFFFRCFKQLYKRVCLSVRLSTYPLVCLLVPPLVCLSIMPFDLASYRDVSEHLMPCIRPCLVDLVSQVTVDSYSWQNQEIHISMVKINENRKQERLVISYAMISEVQ